MPDFPTGPLLASKRYRVERRLERGTFYLHRGLVQFPGLPPSSDPDEQVVVQLKSVAYDLASPIPGEDYLAYLDRRRAELRREGELLACYHEVTAHVPQLLDLIEGQNTLDPQLKALQRDQGEPCLVTEQILAQPLSRIQEPLSQEETLVLAEKLLMILRVFHTRSQATGEKRYFVTLTPEDILVERQTFDCWFTNLWKLRTAQDLSTVFVPGEREAWAFVSPAIAHRLQPAPPVKPSQPAGLTPDDLDLYSVGVLLYFLLAGAPDLSQELPGFLSPQRLAQLEQSRGLRPEVTAFIGKLVRHEFHSAQSALNALCDARKKQHHPVFLPPPLPSRYGGSERDEKLLEIGTVVAGRYEIETLVYKGGQGCVYLCKDQKTRARAILKMLRYIPQLQGAKNLEDFVRERRALCLEEARLALRMHNRLSSVPQIIDVVTTVHPDDRLATHPDPRFSGETEPILIFEYIAGQPLNKTTIGAEADILEFLRSLSGHLARLHEPVNDLFYLYIDWKPENIVYHPETGNFTIVDLGAIVRIVKGQGQYSAVFSTNPYCAPEEYVSAGTINKNLTPAYDIHGLGAVAWQLAARLQQHELEALEQSTYDMYSHGRRPPQSMLDLGRVPASHQHLRSLLEKCLAVDPQKRIQSAAELGSAATAALGRLHRFPPERVQAVRGQSQAGYQVAMSCQLSLDPFCEKIVFCRGTQPPISHTSDVVREQNVAGQEPGSTIQWQDPVDPSWSILHYAAYSVGYNGQASEPIRATIQLAAPPIVKPPVPREEALELVWEIPDVVHRNGGKIIVERQEAAGWKQIYSGLDSRFVDQPLQATRSYKYRFISRLPYGDSSPIEVEARPWPKLLHFDSIEPVPGDGQIAVRWTMPATATADEIVFLRSQSPLDQDDLNAPHKRAQFDPIKLKLDADLNIAAAEPHGALTRLPDGRWQGEWIDATVIPGLRYYYTPVLRYRGKPDAWVERAVDGKAFVEAERVVAEELPGAVRLRWTLPDRVDEVLVERLGPDGQPIRSWNLAADCRTLLDRGLSVGQARHRVRLRFGDAWSAGREVQSSAAALPPVLPPLAVVPGDRSIAVSGRAPAENAWQFEVQIDGRSRRSPLPPAGAEGRWEQTVSAPPWKLVTVRLFDERGQLLGEGVTRAYQELTRLTAQTRGDTLNVTWVAPPGCEKVLLSLPGAAIERLVPATTARTTIGPLPAGEYRLVGRTMTAQGDLSRGVTAQVKVHAPAPREEQPA